MPLTLPANSPMLQAPFIFGVATAAFQIEGASTEDGRLESIWDRFCMQADKVKGADDGRIACDHYHLWESDLELIKSLKVDAYRLSIAWPRVIDKQGKVNPLGIAFYKTLLTALKQAGIQTFVTLYHWDLPQHLEDKGGWLNRQTAYLFQDYANLVSQELAPWVDVWTTFNEPFCSSILGYELGIHAPGLKDAKLARQAAHTILLAHGLAMPVLRQNAPNAQVGIVLNMSKSYPADNHYSSQFASLIAETLDNHFFLEPLLTATYPAILYQLCPDIMPTVLPGDMDIICQPMDYIGLNYYTCNHAKLAQNTLIERVLKPASTVEYTAMGWEVCPQSLTDLLVNLHQQYILPPIYITENGAACDDQLINGEVHDQQRIGYLNGHLNAVHQAMLQGVDIRGYFAWSLMDNFEWAEGYSKRFGLIYVDYASQQRTLKHSALAFQQLLERR